MAIKSPEPVAVIKKRRNKALSKLIKSIPYISFLGVEFLEISAIIELSWMQIWREIENPKLKADYLIDLEILSLPKTIDFSVDYLRSGLPRDSYARAKVNRVGRRYASVHVEAWQDNRDRLFAQGTGHFLMPQPN